MMVMSCLHSTAIWPQHNYRHHATDTDSRPCHIRLRRVPWDSRQKLTVGPPPTAGVPTPCRPICPLHWARLARLPVLPSRFSFPTPRLLCGPVSWKKPLVNAWAGRSADRPLAPHRMERHIVAAAARVPEDGSLRRKRLHQPRIRLFQQHEQASAARPSEPSRVSHQHRYARPEPRIRRFASACLSDHLETVV